MKTPRELLLEKHRVAGPALDAIRREAVAQLPSPLAHQGEVAPVALRPVAASQREAAHLVPEGRAARVPLVPALAKHLLVSVWTELFVPCRRVWLGLAAVWCVIVGLNLAAREDAPVVARGPVPRAEEVLAALQEKREMLRAELGLARVETEAVRPPDPVIRPRSERVQAVAMA